MEVRRILNFASPKPKNDGSGTTIQFIYNDNEKCVFMTLAKQNKNTNVKNAHFDYENKLIFKLKASELGAFILVFNGKQNSINGEKGLFHSFNNVTSTIRCTKNDPKYGSGYYISVNKNKVAYAVKIEEAEAQVLISLFNQAIINIYNWDGGACDWEKSNK